MTIAALSLLHFPISMIALGIGFGLAAGRMEENDARRRTGEPLTATPMSARIISGAIILSLFPLLALISMLQAAGIDLLPRTSMLELAPFIFNSILWSTIVYNLYTIVARARYKRLRREN